MRKRVCLALAGLLLSTRSWAQNDDPVAPIPDETYRSSMTEAAWDWRPGDLVFRNGINDIDEAIKRSFGQKWASVGIVRPSSGGPRVAFADQTDGVSEEMLYEHVEGLSADEYAVYRVRGLDPDYDPDDQMWPGPMVRFALFIAYGQPYDRQFMLGDGAFYNAELVYQSALNAGIALGSPVRLSSLASDPKDLDPILRELLEAHRYCRYELSFGECWTYNLRDQSIVTTESLISSGLLDQVYP